MSSQLLVYIVKRILVMIPTLFVIALICFLVLNLAPGKPGQGSDAAQASGSEEARAQYRLFKENFNFDKPILFNTYFWVEEDEVRALIDDSLSPSATAADKIEARETIEDYGNYVVHHLLAILESAEHPELAAFTANQLILNGRRRNIFLGREDEVPPAVDEEQKAVTRHNNEIGSWRIPGNWAIVPEGFEDTWDGKSKYSARSESGATMTIQRHDWVDGRDIDGWLEELTKELVPGALGKTGATSNTSSLDRAKGKVVKFSDIDGKAYELAVFMTDTAVASHLAVAKAAEINEVGPSFERTRASVVVTFDEQLSAARENWASWYEAEKGRFTLSTGEKVKLFFIDTRFYKYMSNLVQLDFGYTQKKEPVLPEILKRLKYSFILSFLSIFLIYLFSIPIGIFSAIKQHTFVDQLVTLALFVLYSLPTFFVGTLIVQYTPTDFPLATSGFETSPIAAPYMTSWEKLIDISKHLFFPVLTLTYGGLAALSRYARTGLLDVIRADYIRTARAKGLSETVVILKHAVRNGMIPILTILGTLLPVLVGGSIVVEFIFEIDGIGRYLWLAIQMRDYTVIMGILLISAVLTLIGLLISDISYALVDPRITFD